MSAITSTFWHLHRLLDEHRLVRLQRLDQQLGRLRADGAVEVDADVALVAGGLAQFGEALGRLVDEAGRLDDARRAVRLTGPVLKAVKPRRLCCA